MQIFPKHMAATNADRYLKVFRAALFPVVEFVRVIGISWPAEKTARPFRTGSIGMPSRPSRGHRRRGADLADAWAALTPDDGRSAQRPPEQ